MAQVDASIPLGVKPVQIDNPMNALARVLQVKGLQQEQEVGRMKMDEYQRGVERQNRMQQILSTGGDSKALRQGGFLKESIDLDKADTDKQKTLAETTKNRAEAATKKIALYRDAINGVNDAASAIAYMKAMHADPDLKDSAIAAVPLDQALAQVPQDPAQFAEFKRRFTLGAEKFMQDERQRLQLAETNRHNTTTEANTVRGQDITVRGQNLTDSRARENAALTRQGLDIQRQAARTEIKETADGFVLIDKGNGTTTPLKGADGKPLGPKLKDAPPGVQSAVLTNAQNLARAERALQLISGNDIGDPANGGQKGDKEATGLKGFLPNQVLNRVDPKGVDARAAIADLGSLIIHDRSGAAVTAAEFPRLAPFIPTEKDDAAAVKKKLNRFVQVYREEMGAMQNAYNPGTGYRTPGGTVAPAAPANLSGFKVLGVEK